MAVNVHVPNLLWEGTGSTSSIALSVDGEPIVFHSSAEIVVQQKIVASGDITALSLGTHYSIANGPVISSSESAAVLTRIAGALPAGYEWAITRVTPASQSVDLISGGDFSSNDLETMVNRVILMAQEMREQLSRAFLLSVFSDGLSAELPSPAALNYLRWNAGATALENAASVDLTGTAVSGFIETLLDDANAAAARATLDLAASSFVRASLLPVADAAAIRTLLSLTSLATLAVSGTHGQALHIDGAGAAAFSNVSPIGSIVAWPTATAPTGWLECAGTAVSRTTYATLFALISDDYGAGDGSTTFNLPDLRGEFIRGWDHGKGSDADAASRTNRGDGTSGDNIGTKQATQNLLHGHPARISANSGSSSTVTGGMMISTNNAGDQVAYTGAVSNTLGQQIGGSGGSESRPRNVNMMYIIRAL